MRFIINLSSILLVFFLFNACSTVQTKVDQKTKEEQDLLSTYIGKDIEEAFIDFGTPFLDGLDEKEAQEAFRVCSYKLPIKTKTVGRRELGS